MKKAAPKGRLEGWAGWPNQAGSSTLRIFLSAATSIWRMRSALTP